MSIFLKKSYAHNRKQKKTETRALCSKSLFYDFRKSLSVLFDFWTFYKCPKTLFIDSPFWNFLFFIFSRSTYIDSQTSAKLCIAKAKQK